MQCLTAWTWAVNVEEMSLWWLDPSDSFNNVLSLLRRKLCMCVCVCVCGVTNYFIKSKHIKAFSAFLAYHYLTHSIYGYICL